jgi:hypothetical protein
MILQFEFQIMTNKIFYFFFELFEQPYHELEKLCIEAVWKEGFFSLLIIFLNLDEANMARFKVDFYRRFTREALQKAPCYPFRDS